MHLFEVSAILKTLPVWILGILTLTVVPVVRNGASRPSGFDLTSALLDKISLKWDINKAREVNGWIEGVIRENIRGTEMKDFQNNLEDGVILCRLINALRPGSVRRIYDGNMAFKKMENIGNFLSALEAIGMRKSDLFQTVDLFEGQNMPQVVETLLKLKQKKSKKRSLSLNKVAGVFFILIGGLVFAIIVGFIHFHKIKIKVQKLGGLFFFGNDMGYRTEIEYTRWPSHSNNGRVVSNGRSNGEKPRSGSRDHEHLGIPDLENHGCGAIDDSVHNKLDHVQRKTLNRSK